VNRRICSARNGAISIVWHTQGSGKSISMVCFVAKLMQQPEMENPTVVVVTDRNDLDGQLYQTFLNAGSLLRETPKQAEDREELRALLDGRPSGGIIFSTIQKFVPERDEERYPQLSPRTNIVVVADEAHRTQRVPGRFGQEDREVQVWICQAFARRPAQRDLCRFHRYACGE
jgi:type I site-specific restriction-modification system R (restriction) subunit